MNFDRAWSKNRKKLIGINIFLFLLLTDILSFKIKS